MELQKIRKQLQELIDSKTINRMDVARCKLRLFYCAKYIRWGMSLKSNRTLYAKSKNI